MIQEAAKMAMCRGKICQEGATIAMWRPYGLVLKVCVSMANLYFLCDACVPVMAKNGFHVGSSCMVTFILPLRSTTDAHLMSFYIWLNRMTF